MALAPEQGIGIRRHFTIDGTHPYDQVDWSAATHASPTTATARWPLSSSGSSSPSRGRSTPPTSSPRRASVRRHARARVVAAPGDRPGGRHHHPVGGRGWLLRRRVRVGGGVQRRAQAPARHPEGGVQQPGVVQHRREGQPQQASACFILVGRRHGLDPELVPGGGRHLGGVVGRRRVNLSASARPSSCSRVAAPRWARSASCGAPTPRPAPSSRAARPAGPPRW